MESVVKAVVVYLFLMVMFRLAGKRTLSQVTTFDFVLLLIISEAVQQAMLGGDNSMTNAFLLVVTLVGMNILMSEIKERSEAADRFLDGAALVIVDNGKPQEALMRKERVDLNDVLEAARETHGLERMEQIKFAVLERGGKISIIPAE